MASKTLFDQLIGSLSGGAPGSAPGSASGGAGGIGDILNQIGGALGSRGGAAGGAAGGAGGGIGDLLTQLQTGLGGAAGQLGGAARSAGGQLDSMVGDRSSFTKGAAAGGLVGALLGGKGTAKAAGAALIGSLAWRAWQNWQANQAAAAAAGEAAPAAPLPAPEAFLPTGDEADTLAEKLARAMVAAAKADGQVTAMERRRIVAELTERGFGDTAGQLVQEELDGPVDIGRVAALAGSPEEAVQIYTASLLAVDPEAPAEREYLAALAARLSLDPALVTSLHQELGLA